MRVFTVVRSVAVLSSVIAQSVSYGAAAPDFCGILLKKQNVAGEVAAQLEVFYTETRHLTVPVPEYRDTPSLGTWESEVETTVTEYHATKSAVDVKIPADWISEMKLDLNNRYGWQGILKEKPDPGFVEKLLASVGGFEDLRSFYFRDLLRQSRSRVRAAQMEQYFIRLVFEVPSTDHSHKSTEFKLIVPFTAQEIGLGPVDEIEVGRVADRRRSFAFGLESSLVRHEKDKAH